MGLVFICLNRFLDCTHHTITLWHNTNSRSIIVRYRTLRRSQRLPHYALKLQRVHSRQMCDCGGFVECDLPSFRNWHQLWRTTQVDMHNTTIPKHMGQICGHKCGLQADYNSLCEERSLFLEKCRNVTNATLTTYHIVRVDLLKF